MWKEQASDTLIWWSLRDMHEQFENMFLKQGGAPLKCHFLGFCYIILIDQTGSLPYNHYSC